MWKQKSAQMLSAGFDLDFPRDLAMHKHSQNLNSTTCLLVLVNQKPLMQMDKDLVFPHTIPDQSMAVQEHTHKLNMQLNTCFFSQLNSLEKY